jgi:hypothetical protein
MISYWVNTGLFDDRDFRIIERHFELAEFSLLAQHSATPLYFPALIGIIICTFSMSSTFGKHFFAVSLSSSH